ncbi:MAG: TIGR03088 family PEP-CTERM/XrtA system glycosyltransferase [Gammaproteobacteria bacterium]|nr:TIGR03088 family PEP-CTERM/XrtA system glycosyltransferase [Gammaproteobacteria bacterium]
MNPQDPPLVLHVIHHLMTGGLENGLVNLLNRMPADRFRHAIACVEDHDAFRERISRPGVALYALHRSQVGVWGLRRALYRLCRELQPAIVHSRGLSGLDALVPAALAGVPLRVHGEHGWDTLDLAGTRLKPALLRRLHSPFVTRYVAVSQEIALYLQRRVGVPAKRIETICNGVDTDQFTPSAARSAGVLPEGFAAPGTVVIGTLGRLQPVKDQATLVRAFARLREREPALAARARLALVGTGPQAADMQALVHSLGLTELAWLPGARQDIPQVLRSFDVFVLPSLAEGISNTILEAMATGLPVIATAVGGNVELVEEGVSGRFMAPGDIDGLASLLAGYIADDTLRHRHGQAARQAASARFGLDNMVNRYQSLYASLVWPGRE